MDKGHFYVGAIGNIDVNPSSSTATSSLHGTAASLHQIVYTENHNEDANSTIQLSTDGSLKQLP